MGNTGSRPRPRPSDQTQAPYPPYSSPPPGPYFLQGYHPPYPQNNGQFYGNFQGPRGQAAPPDPTQQRPYPGQVGIQNASGADKHLKKEAVIRNGVNVKKNSILLTPLPDNPQKLAVSFTFDASTPCTVTVFFAAVEHTSEACKLTPSKQPGLAGVHYERGLALKFPQPAAEGVAQPVLDLDLYDRQELLSAQERQQGMQYPLVIRLEAITEKGLEAGHSLSELAVGASQSEWVQSQTTCAHLVGDDDGNYSVRVIKQNIWHEGMSYMLQEIYGIEQALAAAKDKEGETVDGYVADQEEERNCVICMVNARDTVVSPCRHMCVCRDCAEELRKQTSKCPICRIHIEALLHIRMNDQQTPAPVDQSTVAAALDKLGLKSSAEKLK